MKAKKLLGLTTPKPQQEMPLAITKPEHPPEPLHVTPKTRKPMPFDILLEIASHADKNTVVAMSSTTTWMRIALRARLFSKVVLNSYEKLNAFVLREVTAETKHIAYCDEYFQ